MIFVSSSEKQTYNLAKKIAGQLKGGEILGLIGPLGAGKTVFVKGLAAGLGIKKKITSPTFVLMKIYPVRGQVGIKKLVHLDLYRLKKIKDLINVGATEYFALPETVVAIEWADKIKKKLSEKTKFVKIKFRKDNQRIINF